MMGWLLDLEMSQNYSSLQYLRQVHVLACFGEQKENSCRMGSSAWNDFKIEIHTHIRLFEGIIV
jgi:hypothetical protein